MEFSLVPWLLHVRYPLDLSNAPQVCETSAVADTYRRQLRQVVGVVHWLQLPFRLLRFLLVVVAVVVLQVQILQLLQLGLLMSETSWLD